MFVALVEVAPIDPDALGEGALGAMVRCYTPAADQKEALESITLELQKAGVRLVDVEWCVNYDEVDWEDAESGVAQSFVDEAMAKGTAVLSEFHVWRDA